MRRALLVLGLAACYSPKVAQGVACAPAGTERCPSGQVCVTRGGIEVCEPAGSTGDADAAVDAVADASDSGGGPAGWWNLAYTHRRPIDVSAGTNGTPAGYSHAVTFDHFDLVQAGQAQVSGDDVRIVRDDGTELARVLDSGSAWNTVVTKVWFEAGDAQAAGATNRYWLYWGNQAASGPPATPARVFEFADDFEGGLGAWTADPGVTVTSGRAHRGMKAAQVGPLSGTTVGAYVNGVIERNVVFDVWWYIDDITNVDAFSGVRSSQAEQYFSNLQPSSLGQSSKWDISRNLNGNYMELVSPPGSAPGVVATTWTRVTISAYEAQMAVDVNESRYVPAAGFAAVPDAIDGAVGLGGYFVASHVWFDDATVRRFVLPEPTVVLGPIESLP